MFLKASIILSYVLLLSWFSTVSEGVQFNLTLPHQHPDPDVAVQELQRRVNVSVSKRQLLWNVEKDQSSCLTGNPIDDCWRCDSNGQSNRQSLADCGIGFGHDSFGGKGGQYYEVTDSSDSDEDNPKPGTLRYGVMQTEPLWITFASNMQIKLKEKLIIKSFKTIDGRGANVEIVGKGCLAVEFVSNIVIHNIHIHHCVPSTGSQKSDGDGISIIGSNHIWVDHCSLSYCRDGLIDVTEGSTAVTISNNYFTNHDKVMLLGHSDKFEADSGMQVTVAFNHFGQNLVERMPRCRHGYFHVVNNDYTQWKEYAVGGSANPTINSQGNRYYAPDNSNLKQVTARMDADEKEWSRWNWRSDQDILVNGAFFVQSGGGKQYAKASSMDVKSPELIDSLTANAGVFGENRYNYSGLLHTLNLVNFNGGEPSLEKFQA
ncbi:hypothetical protein GIB67_018024 [Kingdonia uniflora]|uniref:Pectate lyase n=1 Tax=Kingdonia uniflora TaxID=39325 RepID=A0A7J7NWQ8_9MAGN|nr:hypothetical protein GIB67_018024 [Kingdonia uniflora]